MPGVGGNQERSTYKGTHTQHTQHTYDLHDAQAHAAHAAHAAHVQVLGHAHAAHAAHAQARTPPLPSSSSFPAQPPLVASPPHVFSGQVQRGERRRRRRLTSCPGRVQRGERRSLGGACRFVEVEMVSGDFSSSEQGRGNAGRAMPMRAERERDCARHSTEPTHTLLTKDVINLRDFWRVTKLNPPGCG